MSAKTFDRQTAKFLAVVAENMPELSGDVMQGWIQNPKAMQKVLSNAFCPPEAATAPARMVSIDRTTPFDPAQLLGQRWAIDEQDERSLVLTRIDLSKVRLVDMLEKDENRIKGEGKLARLKQAGHLRLDAKIFQTLWENQLLIPKSWKERTNGNVTFIFFDGTILRDPFGDRGVLYLYWDVGRWDWDCYWLEGDWDAHDPSAVLASI